AGMGLQLVAEPAAWPGPKARIGGVSSFGFGGTNCHIVLEAAPAQPASAETEADDTVRLVTLSAASDASLRMLAAAAGREAVAVDLNGMRRATLPHRLAVIGRTGATIAADLAAFAEGKPSGAIAGTAPRRAPKLAFIYSGQGAQR